MRLGVLTAGGDAPGLNAAIRAVARRALSLGHEVIGVRNGWLGLLEEDLIDLGRHEVAGIMPLGGTILGTARCSLDDPPGGRDRVAETIARRLDGLVAIGGDGTLSVAQGLAASGAPVVGVPKTVDNDLSGTEYCIGFDTAVAIATEAIDRLHTTAASHHRVMVVEVMGRRTGWVAALAGLAGGADLILVPERPVGLDQVVDHLDQRRRNGSSFSIVVVAEGADLGALGGHEDPGASHDGLGRPLLADRGVGRQLAALLEPASGAETRTTVLGHVVRGGTATAYDRIWATRLGVAATDLAIEGRWGVAAVVRDGRSTAAPIEELVGVAHPVPDDLLDLCAVFY